MPMRGISSKAVTASPEIARAWLSSSVAALEIVERAERRRLFARLGKQLEDRGRDDAQGSFGADEQVAQGVAGVVLAERPQPIPDAAIGQYHFQAEHKIAGVAVAQHVDAAGVGGEIAADLTAAFGREAQGKKTIALVRRALDVGEDAAGLDGDGEVDRIDGAHFVHAAEVDQDLAGILMGRGAAAQAGVAALRHDRQPSRGAGRDNLRDLGGRPRPHHQRRAAVIKPALFMQIRRHRVGIGDTGVRADNRGKTVEQGLVERHGR